MRSILLVLALLLAPGAARADWEYARWGMTPEQVVRASRGAVRLIPPGQRSRIAGLDLEHAAEGSFTDGPLRLLVRFAFGRDGGLALVAYAVADAGQNELLKQWLIRRHGPPQQTGGLPAIGMETLSWARDDEIELTITRGERAFVLQSRR